MLVNTAVYLYYEYWIQMALHTQRNQNIFLSMHLFQDLQYEDPSSHNPRRESLRLLTHTHTQKINPGPIFASENLPPPPLLGFKPGVILNTVGDFFFFFFLHVAALWKSVCGHYHHRELWCALQGFEPMLFITSDWPLNVFTLHFAPQTAMALARRTPETARRNTRKIHRENI